VYTRNYRPVLIVELSASSTTGNTYVFTPAKGSEPMFYSHHDVIVGDGDLMISAERNSPIHPSVPRAWSYTSLVAVSRIELRLHRLAN
jgi:hypothetical protein